MFNDKNLALLAFDQQSETCWESPKGSAEPRFFGGIFRLNFAPPARGKD